MDSGNSGSMQSSSGGDEEYDSRAESISALLSNPPSHLGAMGANQPPPHHQHQHHQHQTQLDPLSNLFDPSSSRLSNPNSLLNFDMVWSKTLRSDLNSTDLASLISSSSSTHNQISQPFLTANNNINSNNNIQLGSAQQSRLGGGGGGDDGVGGVGSSTFASLPIPHDQNVSASSSAPSNQPHNNNGVVRNPKKRSRASRRAPTTVLTTDTTNFRAMVQEFTGIPAPPFTSSHFPRGRLDLFGSAAAASSIMRSAGLGGGGGGAGLGLEPSPPSYLLRPFAHKISTSPFDPSINPTTSTTNHNNLLNIQNPSPSSSSVLNFQSLFQPQQQQQPKYPLSINSPTSLAPNSNSKPPHHHHQSSLGPHNNLLDQDHHFGFPLHPHVNADNPSQLNINPNWGDGNHKNSNSNNNNNNVDHHQGLMRSINGSNFANGKLNFSAAGSSSNINAHHHGDRGPQHDQNVTTTTTTTTTRSEGMVESWICSSD